jgi:hypothetical protein
MRPAARAVFIGVSWLLVAGLVVQVFLAGLGVFDSPTRFAIHRDVGYMLELLPLVMLVAAVLGRLGRRFVVLSAAIFGLFLLQSVFIAFRADAPTIAALHPVNGFLIVLLAVVVARDARAIELQVAPAAALRDSESEGSA